MADGGFVPDMAGIREIMHSAGVQKELGKAAKEIADSCNEQAASRTEDPLRQPAYRPFVDQGRYTSLGVVATASKYGRYDQHENQTLDGFAESK